ncbi:MAG: trypsin-like peptidase domain-containing protein [Candidatus Doudnabacteria bacterium]|nr:trypsin-like peptidase domain-containing protein [Candidatus Doudnabacteria bacterium]
MSSIFSRKNIAFAIASLSVIGLSFLAGLGGSLLGLNIKQLNSAASTTVVQTTVDSSEIIEVAEAASKSVVSIVVTKDLPKYERYFDFYSDTDGETEEQTVGAGSGFIITQEGLIVTNRHVVSDEDANYTVVLNDGSKFSAEVIGRDTILDIAIVKIEAGEDLPTLELGDSASIKVGQTVVAIGNSLGEFSNTVSSGIISGLSRSILASSGEDVPERLSGVLQTDASINPGNSGGPLLDLRGKVIGVNVAIAQDAENIGFAIPINAVKQVVDSVIEFGEIVRPYIGIRYQEVTPDLAKQEDLPVEAGAWIIDGEEDPGILPNSPAAKAGLKVGDIITAINGTKLDDDSPLQTVVQEYKVGEEITLTVIRGEQELEIKVTLEKRPD